MMLALQLGIAIAITVVGVFVVADEWRKSERPRGREAKLEAVVLGGVIIGLGVGIGYAGAVG